MRNHHQSISLDVHDQYNIFVILKCIDKASFQLNQYYNIMMMDHSQLFRLNIHNDHNL